MGVYHVTALVALLGPVAEIVAMTSQANAERSILVGPDAGRRFAVTSPTHVHAQLRHAAGTISTVIVSFDGMSAPPPSLTLFGASGSLCIENLHAADATLRAMDAHGVVAIVPSDGPAFSPAIWASGPTRAWQAWIAGKPVATSARRARHVLAVLCAIETAGATRRSVDLAADGAWITSAAPDAAADAA
jgi:predicted dehydrogenase